MAPDRQTATADMTNFPRPGAVLITRPEPGASETAARVTALGLTPITAPLLEIRSFPLRQPLGRIAAILLASGNSVDPLPAALHAFPVLTVGAATARRAEQAGFTNVASADGDAVALVSLVRKLVNPNDGTLLLPAGEGQSLALAADLRASGYRIARRVVYTAIPVARLPKPAWAALASGQTPTVLLFSTETALHFVRLAQRAGLLDSLSRCEAITIGPPAAMALREVPWKRIRIAAKPTQDEMLALLR
jgi:uroporphyrinogen-III synthase